MKKPLAVLAVLVTLAAVLLLGLGGGTPSSYAIPDCSTVRNHICSPNGAHTQCMDAFVENCICSFGTWHCTE